MLLSTRASSSSSRTSPASASVRVAGHRPPAVVRPSASELAAAAVVAAVVVGRSPVWVLHGATLAPVTNAAATGCRSPPVLFTNRRFTGRCRRRRSPPLKVAAGCPRVISSLSLLRSLRLRIPPTVVDIRSPPSSPPACRRRPPLQVAAVVAVLVAGRPHVISSLSLLQSLRPCVPASVSHRRSPADRRRPQLEREKVEMKEMVEAE